MPVTHRTRSRARAIGANAQTMPIKATDRTAAGSNGMNVEHRCTHAHTGDLRRIHALEVAVEARDVGRGATHVEANDLRNSELLRDFGAGYHSARRPGQDGV